ncbi:MAG: transposase [Kiloniellaceae bacterium]|nr:transposase [Kiloniellaceae bacterium]
MLALCIQRTNERRGSRQLTSFSLAMGFRGPNLDDLPLSDRYWLSGTRFERIRPPFPRSHGVPRVEDHRVASGIKHVIRNGLGWRDPPFDR